MELFAACVYGVVKFPEATLTHSLKRLVLTPFPDGTDFIATQL